MESDFKINECGLVRYIGKEKKVRIPDGIVQVSYFAFEECKKLEEINISASVISLDAVIYEEVDDDFVFPELFYGGIFSGCENLINIVVDEENLQYKSIDGNLYSKDGKIFLRYAAGKIEEKFTIPVGVEKIEEGAFDDCKNLTIINIPASVQKIGGCAFCGCKNLKELTIPEGVEEIGASTFCGCNNLVKLFIPDTVTRINYNAFSGCEKLIINLPDTLQELEFYEDDIDEKSSRYNNYNGSIYIGTKSNPYFALVKAKQIDKVIQIHKETRLIKSNAFQDIISGTLYIPDKVQQIDSFSVGIGEIDYIKVSKNNQMYKDIDGNLYSKDGTELILYANGKIEKAFIMPEGVKRIDCCSFPIFSLFEELVINKGLISIGARTFWGCCNLKKVIIPKDVSFIGSHAFSIESKEETDLIIYFEGETIPEGWDRMWNSHGYPIILGYKGDEEKASSISLYVDEVLYEMKEDALFLKRGENIKSYIIPSEIIYNNKEIKVTNIEKFAFKDTTELKFVFFNENSKVENIGEGAFQNCSNLSFISIPSTVAYMGSNVFKGCKKVKIFCKMSSKPEGWAEDWNPDQRPVVWKK